MEDLFLQLEERIEGLVSQLERSLRTNEELEVHNEELQTQADLVPGLREQNSQLEARIERMDGEIRSLTDTQTQIRERLSGILRKIDSMEEVLTGQPAGR